MDLAEVRLLYGYNRWADARALTAAGRLTEEQLTHDLGTSYRSVFGTLVHIVQWEWRWLGRWLGSAPPPGLDPGLRSDLPGLETRWREIARAQEEFIDHLTEASLGRPVCYDNPPGTTWTYPLAQLLLHVVNHCTYHRGQVTTLLRQLGAEPIPTDFLVFIDERNARATLASGAH